MAKRILLTIGRLLLIPGLFYFLFKPVRWNESSVAFKNLAEVPAVELRQKHTLNMTVVVPDTAVWRHVRRSWGDPKYEIALVSLPDDQYCFAGIHVNATERDQRLVLQDAGWMYGFGTGQPFPWECHSFGQAFRTVPGSTVNVTLTSEQFGPGEMIVVRPVWDKTKDKLVGVDLDEDIRMILRWMLLVGLAATALAGLIFACEKFLRRRAAPRNVIT